MFKKKKRMKKQSTPGNAVPEKFNSDVQYFSFGNNQDYMNGLTKYLKPSDLYRSMEQECQENDGGKFYSTFNYVVNQPAKEKRVQDGATGKWRIQESECGHDLIFLV